MHPPPFLPIAAIAACAVATGCAHVASTPSADGTTDLGGGLAMTADGAILGALPLWAPPDHIDGPPVQASAAAH